MLGPVSGTGRAMMASLQQAIQKGMPPDQAVQYVKSMATQGVAPMADLYAMMNQFQRLKQQPVQAPQTPPTIRDQLNMAEQQQMAMQQGLGGLPAPSMEQAQFAGGGIVAFDEGGEVNPISYMQKLVREALARGDTETAEEIQASLEDYTSLGRNLPRISLPERSNLVDLREARAREQYSGAAPAAAPTPSASAAPTGTRPRLGREATTSEVRFPDNTAPPAPERRPPVARRSAGIGAAAAPVEAAVAAPKMPSVADFERELQERSKPLTEAIERQRTFLQGEEATSKEEAKRDRMLALAQAGFAMAQAGSKPGATFLGSAGAAGSDFAKSMMQLNREAAVARRNMQKELFALDQAKAANDVNMYNVAYSNAMKEKEFITQVDQFNQGMRLQQAKLALDRTLGMGQIQASIANAAATLGLRQEELAARIENNKNQLALQVEQLVTENMKPLLLDPAYRDGTPEQRAAIESNVRNSVTQRVVMNSIGAMGGTTSDAVSAADRIVGIGGTR
jgi:hypothetical protein